MEFRPVELVGALVVDPEGYIYGHVIKVDIGPEGPVFKIKSLKSAQESVPDIDALKQDLLRDLKEKFSISNVQELYRFIAKELKIQSVTENDLISYAKLKEVKIPMREVLREVEEEKPYIRLNDIEAINKSELGSCILVKTPIEATIRSIEPQKAVLYQNEESLRGKPVIDNMAKILGNVHGILMSADGLSIQVGKDGMVTRLIPDMNSLKKRIFSEKTPKELMKDIESLGFEQPQDLTDDKLLAYAKMRGYEIPTHLVSSKTVLLYKSSVPWQQIRKIGDVILLNKTLLEAFLEESKIEEPKPVGVYSTDLAQKPRRPSVQVRSFAVGVYAGTFLMIFIGLVPYIGALFSGGVAGYLAREWKRGAVAGLLSGLLGTVIITIILHLLLPIGLKDFLGIILPSFILNATIEFLNYATSEAFLYFESLVNALVGLIGGLFLGFLKSK
ncbi:MAG: hypothetical protein H3Z52_08950 [archaeon]|nr:hypothetical protein [archaeon]MCP8321054.1 hypothetical protein [archaeon]